MSGGSATAIAIRERECLACGQSFTYEVKRGTDRKYCSVACRPKPEKHLYPECEIEGCTTPKRSKSARWCHKHYARWIRHGDPLEKKVPEYPGQECGYCGRVSTRRFCSTRCQGRYDRGSPHVKSCSECGNEFVPHQKTAICSDECKKAREKRQSREAHRRYWESDPEYRRKLRLHYLKRKRLLSEAVCEVFTHEEIFERDGWVCQICHQPIDRDVEWPAPGSVSLDHIVPLSRGGEHTRANTQAAHLGCNCSKNARGTDQLRLIG